MSIAVSSAPSICAIIVSLIAAPIDLKTRKIPNALTFPAAAVGVILNFALGGIQAGLWAIGGLGIGLLLLFLPQLLSKKSSPMGGGDAKLIAAIGAFLGLRVLLVWGFFSLLYGGFAFIKYLILFPWKDLGKIITMTMLGAQATIDKASAQKLNQGMKEPIPLAPFVALGTILTVLLEHPVLQFLGFEH